MALIALSGKIGSGKDLFCSMLKAAIAATKVPRDFAVHIKDDPWTLSDEKLSRCSGYQTKRWAGALKQIVAILIGCTVEQLENREFKESILGEEWRAYYMVLKTAQHPIDKQTGRISSFYTSEQDVKDQWCKGEDPTNSFEIGNGIITVRQLLQFVGTNAIRDVIHPNAWVNALMSQYKKDWRTMCKGECERSIEHDVRGHSCIDASYCYNAKYPNWIIPDTRFPNEADAVKQRSGLVFRINRSMFCPESAESLQLSHPSETSLDKYEHFDEVIVNDGTLEELYEKAKQIVQKYNLAK